MHDAMPIDLVDVLAARLQDNDTLTAPAGIKYVLDRSFV